MISSPSNGGRSFWKSAPLLLLAMAIASPGCTLATEFDQADKPCDGYQKCEDGYYCQIQDAERGEGICVKGVANARSAASLSQAAPNAGPSRHSAGEPLPAEARARDKPCEENGCLRWRGHVCDVERQVCVPQT